MHRSHCSRQLTILINLWIAANLSTSHELINGSQTDTLVNPFVCVHLHSTAAILTSIAAYTRARWEDRLMETKRGRFQGSIHEGTLRWRWTSGLRATLMQIDSTGCKSTWTSDAFLFTDYIELFGATSSTQFRHWIALKNNNGEQIEFIYDILWFLMAAISRKA